MLMASLAAMERTLYQAQLITCHTCDIYVFRSDPDKMAALILTCIIEIISVCENYKELINDQLKSIASGNSNSALKCSSLL